MLLGARPGAFKRRKRMKSAVKARNPLAMGEVGAGLVKAGAGAKPPKNVPADHLMAVPDPEAMGEVARLLSAPGLDDEDADGEVDLEALVRSSASNGELREVYAALVERCKVGDPQAISAYMKIATPILQSAPKKVEELDEDAMRFIESFTQTVKGVAGEEGAHPDPGQRAGTGGQGPQPPAAEEAQDHPTAEPAV